MESFSKSIKREGKNALSYMIDGCHRTDFVDKYFKKHFIAPRIKKSKSELEEMKNAEETKEIDEKKGYWRLYKGYDKGSGGVKDVKYKEAGLTIEDVKKEAE